MYVSSCLCILMLFVFHFLSDKESLKQQIETLQSELSDLRVKFDGVKLSKQDLIQQVCVIFVTVLITFIAMWFL